MENHSDTQIQTWLQGLTQAESKRRESIALAIAQAPTYDTRIIAALKEIALNDSKSYARDAAVKALSKIAEAHFDAGNDIRAYLEQLRKGAVPRRVEPAPVKPIPETPPAPIQALPKPDAPIQPKPIEVEPKPVIQEPQPLVAAVPVYQETAPVVKPAPAPVLPPAPPAPQIPFDQWLLSERNIKFALYSGGFLLLLAGLIFVGVNWAYLPGLVKLGVTLAVTLGMYVGGILLIRRPTLKIGGTALIAIASGFLPLNFVVTHIYVTSELGVSVETIWFLASLVCAIVYFVTARRTQNNLFTSFLLGAILSGTTALMRLVSLDYTPMAFGYGLMTLAIQGAAYLLWDRPNTQFMSFGLRVGAHIAAPFVFLFGTIIWVIAFSIASSFGEVWFALSALGAVVTFYVLDDWRSHTTYARSCAAFLFALLTAFVCTQLHASSIQTGLVLKGLAAIYILLGNFLQRGKKLDAGLPLYIVSALFAAFVTAQALSAYSKTPEHLALALVGDVLLLSLSAYLSRRIEFAYGAVWLLLAPVFIYGNIYLTDWVTRGLAFGVVLLVYTGIAFRIAPRNLKWALPFLSVAAFLSVLVALMLSSDARVLTPVLVVIAVLYAALAVRLNQNWLLLPAFAAINFALISGARLFFGFDVNLARVLAFAFCAWAVILFFGRRALLYLRLNEWAKPFEIGAAVNFGLAYVLVTFIALDDLYNYGFISQTFGITLIWFVGLLALTTYLYRRVEFLFAAVWLFIAPVFIFSRLVLFDPTPVGLTLGALLLGYAVVGYLYAPNQKWSAPFLTAAAFLTVLVPVLLYANERVLTLILVAIALLYGVMAVRLGRRWLVLASFVALDLAVISGEMIFYRVDLDLMRVVAIAFAAFAVVWFAMRRALQLIGLTDWAEPFRYGELANFGLTYALAFLLSALDTRTALAFPALAATLALTLLADVALLSLTSFLYRRVEFLYAATLLLIAPVYLYAHLYLVDPVRVSLTLCVLMAADAAVGFWLGRTRTLPQIVSSASGAFLAAAIALSVLVIGFLYPNYAVMTAVLLGIALMYALGAVWLRLHWLTLAALAALNLALLTGILSEFTLTLDIQRASAIGYSIMGVALFTGAVELKRRGWLKWREPLYLVGVLDLVLSYGLGFQSSAVLFVAVSLVVALICFAMQWVERETLAAQKLPPVLAYLGAVVVLGGVYSGAKAFNLPLEYMLVAIAFGSAMFVFGGLFLDTIPGTLPQQLYGAPFRYVGLVGLGLMLLAATVVNNPLAGALTFALAALAFGVNGLLRKQLPFLYTAGAALVGTLWWSCKFYQVTEWQAYVIPLGVLALVIGWSEARRGRLIYFRAVTLAGLALLLVSAFYQSLSNVNYALLLLLEGAACVGIGVKIRSRIYVEAAILALVANGLAQFGPAFIELPRWVQIGTIGTILLAVGLLALFRRQTLLERRRELTAQWKQWKP